MTERQTHKKEIAKEARQLFKQGGQTKQQVFELLTDKYKYEKDVADVLKYIPSSQAIAKYEIWNNILLAILILITITSYINSNSFWTLFGYGLLIFGVATKRIKYYMWITGLSALSLIFFAIVLLFNTPEVPELRIIILTILLFIMSCILPIWLQKKLCPEPTEQKEKYTTSEGEERMRIVYEFPY